MLETLTRQIKQYKTASILTPVWTALEVTMDVMIPYVTALLIDQGINTGNMQNVYRYGAIMLFMAFLSLMFGILGGRCSAYASTGFAANLRSAMYHNIQRLAFSDIDKYATSGLITRMTTDVNTLQSAYQQILGISVRAPFKLVLSILMCLVIDARLALVFFVALAVLSISLYHIITRVARLFQQVYAKYDELNQSVQENITNIRLVKAFVREDYESKKFAHAAENLYRLYVKAESLMALNHPVMNGGLWLYHRSVMAGRPLYRRGHSDNGRTNLIVQLRDVYSDVVDDALDGIRNAYPECSFGQTRGRSD